MFMISISILFLLFLISSAAWLQLQDRHEQEDSKNSGSQTPFSIRTICCLSAPPAAFTAGTLQDELEIIRKVFFLMCRLYLLKFLRTFFSFFFSPPLHKVDLQFQPQFQTHFCSSSWGGVAVSHSLAEEQQTCPADNSQE